MCLLEFPYQKVGADWEREIGGQGECPLCEAGRTSVQCWVLQRAWGSSGGGRWPRRPHRETSVHTALSAIPSHSGASISPARSSHCLSPCETIRDQNPQNHHQGRSACGFILPLSGVCLPVGKTQVPPPASRHTNTFTHWALRSPAH